MLLRRSLKPVLALVVLATLTFAQTSVSLAACQMERGAWSQTAGAGDPPCPCGGEVPPDGAQLSVGCIAHCTSDLQLAGMANVVVKSPADTPVLLVPVSGHDRARFFRDEPQPLGNVARRVLFQSFLI